jgi:hypothetical protein
MPVPRQHMYFAGETELTQVSSLRFFLVEKFDQINYYHGKSESQHKMLQ